MKKRFFCLAAAACLAISGCMQAGERTRPSEKVSEGSPYRFSLQDIEGNTVTLDGLLANHKAVLLNFWATWCPYCIEEMPDLAELQRQYKDRSFTVVGINAGESLEEAASFSKKMNLNYPVLLDRDMAVSETYGIVGLPTTLLIRSDGLVVGEYHSISGKLKADIEESLR